MSFKQLLLFCLLLTSILSASAQPAKATPQKVYTGLYLMNLYSINMEEHSFYADFYVWFRWKGNIDPSGVEFVNLIEKWSKNAEVSGDGLDSVLQDGSNYRIYRVEGRFFHPFSLNDFPLDKHEIDIQLESPEHTIDSLVFVPDTSAPVLSPQMRIIGWQVGTPRLESRVHDYKSKFGNTFLQPQRYSNLTFLLPLGRPFNYFLLKMMLPLFVVIIVSIGALLLHPSYIDARSSLPIGGLLTAVFLQQVYSSTLPDMSAMVLMDKIYLLAYAIITIVLLQVIRSGNWTLNAKQQDEDRILSRERWIALLYMAIFVVGVAVLVI